MNDPRSTVPRPDYDEDEAQEGLEDQPLSLRSLPRRARNGKIARLPPEVREFVNQQIYEGEFYSDIIVALNGLGFTGIRPQNLSEWRKGGFQDWLHSRREVEDLKLDREALLDMANKPGSQADVAKANEILLSLRLFRMLSEDKRESENLSPRFFRLARLVGEQSHQQFRREHLEFQRQVKTEPLDLLKKLISTNQP